MGGMFAFVMFIYVGVLGVILFFCARAIWFTVLLPRKASREPACENCKYGVSGLTTFQCPECGSDLRQVGIITLPMEARRRGGLFGALFGWSMISLIVWSFIFGITRSFGGGMMTTTAMATSTSTTTLTPSSGAYAEVVITHTIGGTPYNQVEVSLQRLDGTNWTMEITSDYGPSVCRVLDPSGSGVSIPAIAPLPNMVLPPGWSGAGSFGLQAVDGFYAAAGLDTADPSIVSEFSEVFAVAVGFASSPGVTGVVAAATPSFTSSSTSTNTAPWPATTTARANVIWETLLMWGIVGVAFATWAGGVVFIILRRQKILRSVNQPAAPPTVRTA